MTNPADNTWYFLTFQSQQLAASVKLNGVPLFSDAQGRGGRISMPVNPWIMPDSNKLGIEILAETGENPELEVQLFIHDNESSSPKVGQMLASFSYPFQEEPPVVPLPLKKKIPVADEFLIKLPPAKLWTEAETINSLTEEDKQTILTLADEVTKAFAEKNITRLYELMDYRYNDQAVASYQSPERIKEVVHTQFGWIFEKASDKIMPIPMDKEKVSFTLAANNKLVLLHREGGGEAVIFDDPIKKNETSIDIFASRINGKWCITRGI